MEPEKRLVSYTFKAIILVPVIATAGFIVSSFIVIDAYDSIIYMCIGGIILTALIWVFHGRKQNLPERSSDIFLPVFLAFCYYMCVWILIFGFSGYKFGSDLFLIYQVLTFPYFIINLLMGFGGDYAFFPFLNAGVTIVAVLTIIVTRAVIKKKILFDKKAGIYALVFLCLCGVAGYQHYDRSTKILEEDYTGVLRISENSVSSYSYDTTYKPFWGNDGVNNNLKKLSEPATISFTENYPMLDGATAAYPVYAAMVQELYKGLDKDSAGKYVKCSTTDEAYSRLINGEIDIFFGAQPSKQQVEAAAENGVEFLLTPIAKEAFVFLVNRDNPVSSLSLEQIQDIYQKKIVNWKKVGGNNEKIIPFQRSENSGSQTIMLAFVMKDKPLPAPLWEEYSSLMGGMVSRVAEYRNYASAIGYSFRFFATGMEPNESVKLLAIDGIEPSVENIRNGTYPFTVDVYAVTAGSANENTAKLIDWILSEQGQNFIETCGYVKK